MKFPSGSCRSATSWPARRTRRGSQGGAALSPPEHKTAVEGIVSFPHHEVFDDVGVRHSAACSECQADSRTRRITDSYLKDAQQLNLNLYPAGTVGHLAALTKRR